MVPTNEASPLLLPFHLVGDLARRVHHHLEVIGEQIAHAIHVASVKRCVVRLQFNSFKWIVVPARNEFLISICACGYENILRITTTLLSRKVQEWWSVSPPGEGGGEAEAPYAFHWLLTVK